VLLAFAALSVLSLYRQTLGFPVFYLGLLATMLFWTTQATSWNLLSGYSGYFSFGQAAYVGVGAYTTAVLYGRHQVGFFVSMLAAAALAGLLALAVGALAFRLRSLRGEIFALLTLAVPFILAAFARINPTVDGGQGIVVPVPPFPAQLGQTQDFLYLVDLAVAGLAVAAAFAVQHARIGWALTAVRDAEDVGEALGVATFRYKLQAIVLSAVIAGVSGSVFAVQIGFVTVDGVFTLTVPLFVIVMSVLGGRTHWLGPVLGAVLIVLLQDRLSSSGLDRWRLLVLGAVLVVLVAAAPDGLYSRLRRRPWPALAAGVLVVGGLRVAGRWGGPADWLLVGMLAAAAVAAWPGRRHRAGRTVAGSYPPGQPDQPAAPRSAPAGPASVDPPAADATVLVDCRQVTRYFGGVRAVSEVSLQIRAGELVGLVGPNGSGKTTLVGLLSGALQPTSGSIRVAGRDISGLPPHRVAHCGIARTYQIPRPFGSMTVRDNVALAVMFGRHRRSLADSRRAAEDRLGFVGLDHLAGALPAALNLHQRQLLEIARAIATEPAVLFLDEALAGLNPAEIDNAVRVIKRIHRSGVAIVIIEHVLRVVNQLATRIVVLDRGTRLADGDPRTVLADPAVVAAYLGKRAHA
jgi:branched-chain amino acid transport system permease protein